MEAAVQDEDADYLERARPKIAQLLKLARGKSTLLAQTHDYPDPDTIASALALCWLMKEIAGVEGTIGYGGIIGRAENRAMIRELGLKLKKTTPADFEKYELIALLDTQPECGNHSLPEGRVPDIVVDHHFEREGTDPEPAFADIGGSFGTTSTKVAELIRAAGLKPPPEVATALFYGVKSDTLNLARVTTPADVSTYLWLFPLVDRAVLAEIEHPQVPLDYFRVVNKAIERGKLYGNMIVADLGEVYTPDLNAELADRMLQVEGVRHALATGWFEGSLFLSLRTRSRNKNAGRILNSIVTDRGIGSAGGHGPMAGARIPMEGKTVRARTDLRRRLIHAILEAFDQDPHHFQRLMSAKKARAQAKSRANGNGAADKAEKADKGDGSDGEAEPSNGARKSKPPKRQSAPP